MKQRLAQVPENEQKKIAKPFQLKRTKMTGKSKIGKKRGKVLAFSQKFQNLGFKNKIFKAKEYVQSNRHFKKIGCKYIVKLIRNNCVKILFLV